VSQSPPLSSSGVDSGKQIVLDEGVRPEFPRQTTLLYFCVLLLVRVWRVSLGPFWRLFQHEQYKTPKDQQILTTKPPWSEKSNLPPNV